MYEETLPFMYYVNILGACRINARAWARGAGGGEHAARAKPPVRVGPERHK